MDKPSSKEIPHLMITRKRARELSERARPTKGALKIRESYSERESDSETSLQ